METTELLERIETLDRKVKRHRKFSINLCERLAKLESFLDGFEGGAAFESIKHVVEPQPREWRVGDRVRLESCTERDWTGRTGNTGQLVMHCGLDLIDGVGDVWILCEGHTSPTYWPASALTLVQAAGEPELTSVDILADEVVQLEKQRDTLQAKLSAERARVDALAELVKDLARQQREDF